MSEQQNTIPPVTLEVQDIHLGVTSPEVGGQNG